MPDDCWDAPGQSADVRSDRASPCRERGPSDEFHRCHARQRARAGSAAGRGPAAKHARARRCDLEPAALADGDRGRVSRERALPGAVARARRRRRALLQHPLGSRRDRRPCLPSWPSSRSRRAQCCEPLHASIATRQGAQLAKCSRNFARVSRKSTISPVSISTQCSCNTLFAVSTPNRSDRLHLGPFSLLGKIPNLPLLAP